MFGTISDEIEMKVAASEAWKVFGTLLLAEIVVERLPNILHKVDLLEGDGGAGSVLLLSFPPGSGLSGYKEKFTVIDDEKRVKVAEVIEGGYLDLGLEHYQVRLEVIEKHEKHEEEAEDSCIIKATVAYETNDLAAAGLAVNSIQNFVTIMKTVADYLTKPHENNNS